MSAIRDFLAFAERQCAVIENAAKAAAKRPRLEVVPGEIRYPAAEIEAASDPVEFDRLLVLAMQQVRRDGAAAAYLAPKLDEVREAYAALLDSETEALVRQRFIGQGPLIRLEAAITDLQRWADESADDQPADEQHGSHVTSLNNGQPETTADTKADTRKNSRRNSRFFGKREADCVRAYAVALDDDETLAFEPFVRDYCETRGLPADGVLRKIQANATERDAILQSRHKADTGKGVGR